MGLIDGGFIDGGNKCRTQSPWTKAPSDIIPPPKWQLGQNPPYPNHHPHTRRLIDFLSCFIVSRRTKHYFLLFNFKMYCLIILDWTTVQIMNRKATKQFMYPKLALINKWTLFWPQTDGFRKHGSKCKANVLSTEGYTYSNTNVKTFVAFLSHRHGGRED